MLAAGCLARSGIDRKSCILRRHIIGAHLKAAERRFDVHALVFVIIAFLNVNRPHWRLHIDILAAFGLTLMYAARCEQKSAANERNACISKVFWTPHILS